MSHDESGVGVGEQRPSNTDDGGPVTAGSDPPLPSDPVDLLDRQGPDEPPGAGCHALRVSLDTDSDRYARRIVEELAAEVDVLGTTLGEDRGPNQADCFDVLVRMDYAPETVADALVEPSEVSGATVVAVPVDRLGADDDAEAAVDTGAVPATASSEETGNHPTFEQFKLQTDPIEYDELVDKLESTSLPGEFDTGFDLQPILEGEGDDAPDDGSGDDGELDVPVIGEADGESDADDDAPDAMPARSGDPEPETVVEGLVSALEDDAITDDQRRTLVDTLTDDDPPKTLLVKLDHLQREVDELAAYKGSLEAFIDEYGSGEGLVDEVRATMQEFAGDVNDLSREVEQIGQALAATEGRVEDVEGHLGGVDDQLGALDDVAAAVENHATRLEAVDELRTEVDALGAIGDRLDSLEGQIEALDEAVEAGGSGTEAVAERLGAVEADIGGLGVRVETLEAETAASVEDVEDRLDDVETRLDRHDEFQERFQALLSNVGGGEGSEE